MKGIIVFDEASIPLASVGFEELEMSSGLFTSFMSAMQMYAGGMSGGEVQELEYGTIKMILGKANKNHVITIHSSLDKDANWNHEMVIQLIEERNYSLDNAFLFLLRELLTDNAISAQEARHGIESLWKE
ncbi:MAG: hypothetical protein ACW98Y_07005 [Candidatus Thorarchaeota archaeon]|jgi:hypothetical protein